ncbi:hypothetical protein SteCoe_31012 [Stentor coeruleus]|uniref:Uncharacterized protein n=1 Tax=Stentor coeruleus TaxID=5963 RepID=A0A1R2B2Q2_9CILI|nr:hypothetical protein SteCoe_31012 [Stentor coeruleus]
MIRGVSHKPESTKNIQFVLKYNENTRLLKPNEINRKFDCTILLCGVTGCGKSAILNSIVNFVEGRNTGNLIIASKISDKDKLDMRFTYNKNQSNQIQQTTDVLCIQVLWKGKEMLFIDTPGYDENNKGQADIQTLTKIKQICEYVKKIDYIFFVQKFTDSQFFKSSEVFLNKIYEIFNGKSILILTFKTGRQQFDETRLPFKVNNKYCLNNGIFNYNNEKLLGNNAKEVWEKIYRKIEMIMNDMVNDLKLGNIDERDEFEQNMQKKLVGGNYKASFVADNHKNMICLLCYNTCLRKVSKDYTLHELNQEYSIFSNQFNDKMLCKHCDHPKDKHDCLNMKLQVITEEKIPEEGLNSIKSSPKIIFKEDRKEYKDFNQILKNDDFEKNKPVIQQPIEIIQTRASQSFKPGTNIINSKEKIQINKPKNVLPLNKVTIRGSQRAGSSNQKRNLLTMQTRNKK